MRRLPLTREQSACPETHSFSEALIACQSRCNLEYCNNVTNATPDGGA